MVRFEETPRGDHEIRAVFNMGDRDCTVCFCSEDVSLSARPESLVAAGLLPAMRRGLNLHLDLALDPVFLDHLQEVKSLFAKWEPLFKPIRVVSAPSSPVFPDVEKSRVGLFFSGGVDSLYTLLTHQDEITDLIFVHGFDIHPDNLAHGQLAEESVRKVGRQFGKRVIKVETNLRSFLDLYAAWGERAHGAAMAAVAHLLSDELARIYISASDSGAYLLPWGSHPDLDPFWSSSGLEFIHDGCETTRTGKLGRIAESDIALEHLRVCWKNQAGALNCGRCEKCIRTMIGLKITGALDRCTAFEKPLRLWTVLGIKIPHPKFATGQLDNLAALKEDLPEHRWLYWALSVAFFRSRLRERFKTWRH